MSLAAAYRCPYLENVIELTLMVMTSSPWHIYIHIAPHYNTSNNYIIQHLKVKVLFKSKQCLTA